MEASAADHRRTTRYQDAVRVLFLLAEGRGDALGALAPPGACRAIHSQARLQALDFWMRNPDYLAHELIALFDGGTRSDGLSVARSILESEEPDLRRYPMLKYLFGAYEPLDDALALLRSSELIAIVREGDPVTRRVREHHYFLLEKGLAASERVLSGAPALSWYRDRARLVVSVAGDAGGSKLKERQYETFEYAMTELGKPIASIAADVRADLARRRAQ